MLKPILLLGLLGIAPSSYADEALLEFIYTPELETVDAQTARAINDELRDGRYDAAVDLSTLLIDRHIGRNNDKTYSNTISGQLMINQGILQFTAGDGLTSLETVTKGLALFEERTNPFSLSLVSALMAKGLVEGHLDKWVEAEDSFRRAQHIVHRHDGVYSDQQIDILFQLTKSSMRLGDPMGADKQQTFILRVAEQAYGAKSEELLPIIDQVARYFSIRSYSVPPSSNVDVVKHRDRLFRRSVALYKQSIEIIEQTYGENDLRLLKPLRGLGRIRLQHVSSRSRAEDVFIRARQIVEDHPASDALDRARAIVDVGDLYTMMREPEKAEEAYLEVWALLKTNEDNMSAANLMFGNPVRLHPQQKEVIYLERTPDAAKNGEALHASLSFLVDTAGRVRNIEILSKNVPNEPLRSLRRETLRTLYRPRIEEGEIVATEGLVLHQQYRARVKTEAPVLEESTTEESPPKEGTPQEPPLEISTPDVNLLEVSSP
ncbi:MAG: tetratricopeptide (TPR) repeat protein [Candidatus Azotimanducaceae bacterium]